MPRITAIVCANGLGHMRRVVAVLAALSHKVEDASYTLVCTDAQARAVAGWPEWQALARRTRLLTNAISPGVIWSTDARTFDDGRLLAWETKLRELPPSDLLLSDNLAGALSARPDAVLMGSFLWSDVLEAAHPKSAAVARFVEHERTLLSRHHPPMLCVADVVMPGVTERTKAVALPWFTGLRAPKRPRATMPVVAVLGGATDAAAPLLARVAAEVAARGWPVPRAFAFRASDYASCDVVVCRPGVGTLTDCVGQALPIVALHEAGNLEMTHLGRRVEALGIGVNLGADPEPASVADAVAGVLERRVVFEERLRALRRDGLARAAAWLSERLLERVGVPA